MRALVTGASGFVGSHLSAALLKRGWDAIGMCRKPDHRAPPPPNRLVTGDVTDAAFLRELLKSHRFDVIFHLAGRNAFSEPVELYKVNVVGTASLLEAVRYLDQPELKIVLLGSSAQYGAMGSDPIGEDSAFNPVTNYGISKIACEAMGRLLFEQTGQHVVCARGFNIIGPDQGTELLQGAVIEQIVAIEDGRQPAAVEVGDLSAYRDFIDVRDIATGLMAVAEYGEAGQAYNICTGQATQVREFIEGLVALANTPIQINLRERQGVANLPYQKGSYQKLKAKANWVPTIPLEKSLSDALNERRRRVECVAARTDVENAAGNQRK